VYFHVDTIAHHAPVAVDTPECRILTDNAITSIPSGTLRGLASLWYL
jgi:hypothetical protein